MPKGTAGGWSFVVRDSNLTSELIFFWPMPAVADSSSNGVSSRSLIVRPRNASGKRRSFGMAQ